MLKACSSLLHSSGGHAYIRPVVARPVVRLVVLGPDRRYRAGAQHSATSPAIFRPMHDSGAAPAPSRAVAGRHRNFTVQVRGARVCPRMGANDRVSLALLRTASRCVRSGTGGASMAVFVAGLRAVSSGVEAPAERIRLCSDGGHGPVAPGRTIESRKNPL